MIRTPAAFAFIKKITKDCKPTFIEWPCQAYLYVSLLHRVREARDIPDALQNFLRSQIDLDAISFGNEHDELVSHLKSIRDDHSEHFALIERAARSAAHSYLQNRLLP